MDVRSIYEVWAGGRSISPEVTQMRSSEDWGVRECFRFFFLAVKKSRRLRFNEY